jgi:hypothetical protein
LNDIRFIADVYHSQLSVKSLFSKLGYHKSRYAELGLRLEDEVVAHGIPAPDIGCGPEEAALGEIFFA